MNYFRQFDISDFFNEIKEPIFLMDAEEVIFWNSYALENYVDLPDNWKSWFSDPKILKKIACFFEEGEVPIYSYCKSLQHKEGDTVRFEWGFINMPSSYQSRFLIVKGTKNVPHGRAEGVLMEKGAQTMEELGYMQGILNNSHDMIVVLDESGNYKYVSESVGSKLGIPVEEIVGKNFREFVKSGAIELVKGDFQEVLISNKEVNVDFWIRLRNGRRVYLQSFGKNLLHHPEIKGLLFSSRDITEYIETEKSLRKRFEIENLINHISTQLINSGFKELEKYFQYFLERVGTFIKAKNSAVFIFNKESGELEVMNSWQKKVVGQVGEVNPVELIFSRKNRLEAGIVKLADSDDPTDPLIYFLIPMISDSGLLGVIYFEIIREDLQFQEKELQVFRQLGDALAGAYIESLMTRRVERNENLLATTERLSKSGSWRFNVHSNRFYISGGMSQLFEIGDQPDSMDFSELIFKIEKPYGDDFVEKLKESIANVSVTSGELVLKDSQDKSLYISYEIESRKDPLSQGLEVTGFCRDITHKRAAEEYLRFQSQILAQVSDPIIVTDLDMNVIYLNTAASQLCCPESAEGYSGRIDSLIFLDSRESYSFEKIGAKLQVGNSWKKEVFLRTRYSALLPFDISIQAIHAEGIDKVGYSFILRNLTEKYESEQMALRARMIVENSPVVLFQVDPNDRYRILYISENIDRFGYQSGELIENSVSITDLIHPDDLQKILQDQSKDGLLSFSGEYRVKKSDGSYCWVEDKTSEVVNESGEIVMHEGLFQDITERKIFDEYKEEKEKQYRVLASNIPWTNIFLLDQSRKYILAEGTHFDYWEKKPEDFEGKYLHEAYLTKPDELKEELDEVYYDPKILNSEFLYKNRYYHRTIRPVLEHGKVVYVLIIIRDITSEHEAKEKLSVSEEKYRTLVEESTEIIFSLSDTLELKYLSPNVKQYLGYEVDEMLGKSILNFIHPEDINTSQFILSNLRNFLGENQSLEFRLRLKNGEYKIFSSSGRMIRDKRGKHSHYTGIARDISKLKEAQNELLKAKEKAEQDSLVKSQFLSVMSHEIKTPMNAVIGLAHFLMEEEPRPDQLENLKTLQFSAENLMILINDILDFNKIESGKLELENVPFDIRNLLRRIVHSHSFRAQEKGLKLSFKIEESIPQRLVGDPVRIGQIAHNLVSNAIKFTEKGYVKIQLSEEKKTSSESVIHFRFIDSGIGIPKDKIDTIFETFTQATSSTTRKYGGSGLGLAIVKRLVELHNGNISCVPNPTGGSVFEFTIPFKYKSEKEKKDVHTSLIRPKSLNKVSVLVAEDNVVNQIMIRKFLKKWEVGNLRIASNGQEALALFEEGFFNIVLLDLQMPIMDGFSVARAIRAHKEAEKRNVLILVLTATSIHEIKAELEEIGIDGFISKPFTPEVLYEKLVKYLQPKL